MTRANILACLRELMVTQTYGFRGEGGGIDCWDAVRMGALRLYGLRLPDFPCVCTEDDVTPTMLAERVKWLQVEQPAEGDVVMFSISAMPWHVGLVLEPPLFLHCLRGRDLCVEQYDSLSWRHRLAGFYRWPLS